MCQRLTEHSVKMYYVLFSEDAVDGLVHSEHESRLLDLQSAELEREKFCLFAKKHVRAGW